LPVEDSHISHHVKVEQLMPEESRVAEMTEKMRKRSRKGWPRDASFRNDKALNNQGFVVHKMAEAMGFELMDLLQSTVFKTVALNHSATPPFALRAP
jgi:hypothetical protein